MNDVVIYFFLLVESVFDNDPNLGIENAERCNFCFLRSDGKSIIGYRMYLSNKENVDLF